MRGLRHTVVAASALGLAVLLLTAAPAGAGTLYAGAANNYGEYEVPANQVNNVTLTFDGSQYTFTDTAGIALLHYNTYDNPDPFNPYPPFCTQVDANTVRCPGSIGSWRLELGAWRTDDVGPGGTDSAPNSFRYNGPLPPALDPDRPEFLSIYGGTGSDNYFGSPGHDTLDVDPYQGASGTASNGVNGGAGDDTISGENGPDELHGGAGADQIRAGAGPDRVFGDEGKDNIQGDQGDDTIRGGADNDRINGLHGQDKLYGEAGNDSVEGGPGSDLSDGGPGKDGLSSSFHGSGCPGGRDTFVGGPGNDGVYDYCGTPIFQLRGGGRDTVSCGPRSRPVRASRDALDRFTGRFCTRFNVRRRRG